MAAAVTRVCEKRAVAETSSAIESGVEEVTTTSDVDTPVTQHNICDFWYRVEEMSDIKCGLKEMHSMLVHMVISSPTLGHRDPGPTDTPTSSRLGEQFGYGHTPLYHTHTMVVVKTGSATDVYSGGPRATAMSIEKKTGLT
ncbi:hypothetical protein GGI05_001497 [Coemansia sp. RSA 2603]|nr:hypothetical protein GGI05_001497 [Coemansia sp. RSA 2603]